MSELPSSSLAEALENASKNVILACSSPTPNIKQFLVQAPLIASRHRPGHFIMVRVDAYGERIPLTVADSDAQRGTITLIVQAIGASTSSICRLQAGDSFHDLAGPLGAATEIENFGHVVLVGGGVGTAVIFPQAKALKAAGNKVSAVIGGRNKDYVMMEPELCALCDHVYPCTDDGSHGYKGFVTGQLKDLIGQGTKIDRVITAGPLPMMRAIAAVTKEPGITTVASLVTIMVDGTGMCGGCRVTFAGEQRLACIDGPEFDAHKVDFDELIERLRAYRAHEKVAFVRARNRASDHVCKLEQLAEQRSLRKQTVGNL